MTLAYFYFDNVLCLENPMDKGAWWATVHGVTKNQTQLAVNTHTAMNESQV